MALQQVSANFPKTPEGNPYRPVPVQLLDASGNLAVPDNGLIPQSASAVGASSGNVGNASAAATLAAVAGKTNYITGIEITGAGATAAGVQTATITGLAGGTQSITVAVPAGVTTGIQPIVIQFCPPFPASAANTAITVTLPALGTGNTNACVNVRGVQL